MRVLIAWLVAMVSVGVSHAQNETNREILSQVILLCDLSGTSKMTIISPFQAKETKIPRTSVTVQIQKVRDRDRITYQAKIGERGNPFWEVVVSFESPNSETEYSFQDGSIFDPEHQTLVINRLTGTLGYYKESKVVTGTIFETKYFGTCEKQTKQKF